MRIAAIAASVWLCASLDANTIRRVFRRHTAQIKYCYEQQLEKNHALRGRLVVKVTIDGKGHVVAAEISESELVNEALHECITAAVRKWEFPVVGNHAVYTITYPYVFEPAPPPPPAPPP
jgi:TonB family protein